MKFKTRRAVPEDQAASSVLLANCGGTAEYRKQSGQFNVASLTECGSFALAGVQRQFRGGVAAPSRPRRFLILSL